MKRLLSLLFIFIFPLPVLAQAIPKGEIKGPFQWVSEIYPGTVRQYWLYVPQQYESSRPACLMVVQDGLSRATGWHLPAILDSLIALKSIPVMIGLFVDHGTVPPSQPNANPRYNRSFEYDALGDRYSRFLIEELLPEVQRMYNISSNANDRSIAGASSGAICAFNVAWERPDQFSRVLSTIGTYVGLRGADEFATLVRKTEPKPIRIYLEDGDKDLNIYAGDWWISNQAMLSALNYAGYEVHHGWGTGGHDSKHAIQILPEALVWLWKDYPSPVKVHKGISPRIKLLADGEPWIEILLSGAKASRLATNKSGDLFYSSGTALYKVRNTEVTKFAELKTEIKGISCSPSGQIFAALKSRSLVGIDESGKVQPIAKDIDASYLCSSEKGLYFADPNRRIGFYHFNSKAIKYVDTHFIPVSISISPEKTFLNAGGADIPFGYSFQIEKDGNLTNGQPYTHYHIPYEGTVGVGGMTVDSQNLLYTATEMGVQVSDQLGRVNFIFSSPDKPASDVQLAGPSFDELFVIYNGKIFRRKISAKGILSWGSSVSPPKPGL